MANIIFDKLILKLKNNNKVHHIYHTESKYIKDLYIKNLINGLYKNYNIFFFSSTFYDKLPISIHNIYSFFNYNPDSFKEISIRIKNSKIKLFYDNYNYNNSKGFYTLPDANSYEYKLALCVGETNKNNKSFIPLIKNGKLNMRNNILIVDNIDHINLNFLFFLEKSLQIFFKNNKFFGGISTVFFGKFSLETKNIFHSCLFHNNKVYNKFYKNYRNSIWHLSTDIDNNVDFAIKHMSFMKYNSNKCENMVNFLHSLFIYDINYNNILYEKVLKNNSLYISNNKNCNNNLNNKFLNKKKKVYKIKKYEFIDYNLFSELPNETKIYYNNIFPENYLYIRKNAKVYFIKNISEYNIKKGNIGKIKKICFDSRNIELTEEDEPVLEVEILNKIYVIKPETIKYECKKTRKPIFFRRQFPFVLGWAINVKDFYYIPQSNLNEIDFFNICLSFELPYNNLSNLLFNIPLSKLSFSNIGHIMNTRYFTLNRLERMVANEFYKNIN